MGALKAGPTNRIAALVTQENYVSDQPGVAEATDPELVNAWGLAFNPAGPAWVSSNGRGLSPVFDSEGNRLLRVVIPTAKGGEPPSAPTGQVFNGDSNSFKGDVFIFVTEDGTVSGWQPAFGTEAMLRADRSKREAIYKGVTIAENHGRLRLYAADFHNNRIDIFDDNYRPLRRHDDHDDGKRGDHHRDDDRFVDRHLPDGFAPFNILAHGDLLFVTYAKQDADAEDDVKGPGNGFVDVFDTDGELVQRLISRGVLDSPWGMAFQPPPEGKRSERLLVGNFGDGRVNVFQLVRRGEHLRATLKGALGDAPDHPLVIDGLWALVFGLGAGGFDADDLYFTAGPEDETHGLFGEIGFVEEDASASSDD